MGAGAHANWGEVINPPGAEVTGSSELSDIGAKNWTLVLFRSSTHS